MINFEDLSPEDQGKLLEQARQIIDAENLEKDAIAVYKIKRKEHMEQCLESIYDALHIDTYFPDKENIKRRYSSLVNYLFKIKVTGEQYSSSPPNVIITNTFEWNTFVAISNDIKDTIIRCYNIKE